MAGLSEIERRIHNFRDFVSFDGVCVRNTKLRYANTQNALSDIGSKIWGGRYNFRGLFGVLYLSRDMDTCLAEFERFCRLAGGTLPIYLPRAFISVNVRLVKVLDLTRQDVRRAIGVSRDLLTKTDWQRIQLVERREAPTQSIGRFARAARIEGIIVPSAACRGSNVDIFCENVLPGSEISLLNPNEFPPASW